MSKTAKTKSPDLLTTEEASSILGVGQREVQIRFSNGSLTKRRASNGEVRVSRAEVDALVASLKPLQKVTGETTQEYAERVTAGWPKPSQAQIDRVAVLLFGGMERKRTGPTEYELDQRKKMYEREEALKGAKKLAESMTACDVCNLQPDVHHMQRARGVDMHEWTPGRAEKLMKKGAKK